MPTGSLCAERNAIGTALAHDPGLRREHLKMVAVVALHLNTGSDKPPSSQQQARDMSSKSTRMEPLPLSPALSSSLLLRPLHDDLSPLSLSEHKSKHKTQASSLLIANNSSKQTLENNSSIFPNLPLANPDNTPHHHHPPPSSSSPQPVSSTTTSSSSSVAAAASDSVFNEEKKRLTTTTSSPSPGPSHQLGEELQPDFHGKNPISPCGACSEWLRKIAEVCLLCICFLFCFFSWGLLVYIFIYIG